MIILIEEDNFGIYVTVEWFVHVLCLKFCTIFFYWGLDGIYHCRTSTLTLFEQYQSYYGQFDYLRYSSLIS